jgi:hypothetical protein
MTSSPSYYKGDYNASCDVCGRQYKASSLIKRWDGLMCCKDDYEIRQPQEFVRGVADIQVPPWTRPEGTNTFVYESASVPFAYAVYSSASGQATIFFEYAPDLATTFTVTSSDGQTATGTRSPIIVTGLTEGVRIGFTVHAVNSLGTTIKSNIVYTCADYTIPAFVDFGVVQISGPRETPYTVPTSTTTYETISTNPCGGILRKRIDTSWAGSSAAGFITTTPNPFSGSATPPPNYLPFNIGATQQQAIDTYNARLYADCPQEYSVGTFSYTKSGFFYNTVTGEWCVEYMPGYSINFSWKVGVANATIYYLDNHITWTYEQV